MNELEEEFKKWWTKTHQEQPIGLTKEQVWDWLKEHTLPKKQVLDAIERLGKDLGFKVNQRTGMYNPGQSPTSQWVGD